VYSSTDTLIGPPYKSDSVSRPYAPIFDGKDIFDTLKENDCLSILLVPACML